MRRDFNVAGMNIKYELRYSSILFYKHAELKRV